MNKPTENKEAGATYQAPAIEQHVSSESLDRESHYAGVASGSQVESGEVVA